MSEEKFCHFHKDILTRLSCSACGKGICPKCMVNTPVGYKCPDCTKPIKTHIENIEPPKFLAGIIAALAVGAFAGYLWFELAKFGALFSFLLSYFVGLAIAKTMSKIIGSKIGTKIQIAAALITIISIVYNPIVFIVYFGQQPLIWSLFAMTVWCTSCIIKLLSVFIAVWTAVKEFKV